MIYSVSWLIYIPMSILYWLFLDADKPKQSKKPLKSIAEPTTSKSLLDKVRKGLSKIFNFPSNKRSAQIVIGILRLGQVEYYEYNFCSLFLFYFLVQSDWLTSQSTTIVYKVLHVNVILLFILYAV